MDVFVDPPKDAANLAKHGLSLSEAAGFDFASALIREDRRFNYGEQRMQALGWLGERLVVLVYVDLDDDSIRAISLRPADSREWKAYGEHF